MDSKVIITYCDDDGGISTESLWGEQKEKNLFQIKNIPFFAPNISFNDIIEVVNEDNEFHLEEIKERSFHSTIQLVFFDKSKKESIINSLEKLGCSWEGIHNQDYLAIDVAPELNYQKVSDYLAYLYDSGVVDYKEASLSEKHQSDIGNDSN